MNDSNFFVLGVGRGKGVLGDVLFVLLYRVSELTRDLESTKKTLSEHEAELAKYEERNRELASTVQQSQTQADDLQCSLTKARTKNEELSRIRREIETVLVEQEKQVTTYEEQLKQMTIERNNEMELAHRRDAEVEQVISSLRDECQSQQQKIGVLYGLVQQLREQLEQEKCAAVSRDDSRRSGMQDRDALIAKLKALVRENQATADRLKEELSRMNEEAKDKNRTIARLRRSCEELGARCAELEAALCRTSLDSSHSRQDLTQHSTHLFRSAVDHRQSLGKARSIGSETSIELIRHAQDYDEQDDADSSRQRHISATQVSAPLYVADGSTYMYDATCCLPPNQAATPSNLRRSKSAESVRIQAGGDGSVTDEAELTVAEALTATRKQLLRQVYSLAAIFLNNLQNEFLNKTCIKNNVYFYCDSNEFVVLRILVLQLQDCTRSWKQITCHSLLLLRFIYVRPRDIGRCRKIIFMDWMPFS